jgi:hypothetical protein
MRLPRNLEGSATVTNPTPEAASEPAIPRGFIAKKPFRARFADMCETSFWQGEKDGYYRILHIGRKAVVPVEDAEAFEEKIKSGELAGRGFAHCATAVAKSVESRRLNPPKRRRKPADRRSRRAAPQSPNPTK